MKKQKVFDQITVDPKIRFGKPCIAGTRIAVTDILNLLTAGYAIEEIPKQYPHITKKDVISAINFTIRILEKPYRLTQLSSPSV